MRRVLRILRFERLVSDLARSVDFYVGALGFEVAAGPTGGGRALLRRAGETLVLEPGGGAEDVTACDQGFQHLALPVTDIDAAMSALAAYAPQMISKGGPQLLPASSGGVTAVKFCDPDGHPLEFLRFPDGRRGGIDHSAIVVSDADRSIDFYRDRFGLSVVARQTNAGPEQDRLDGLSDVQVDVVALSAEVGTPHLELLGYRSPAVRLRRPRARPSTRMVFEMDDASARELVHDPDGHALLLLAKT